MSAIQHPTALILDELVGAGVPHNRIHAVAERIRAAYDELNSPRPRPVHTPAPAFDSAADSASGRAR